jgi:hypothetical protein
MARARAVFALLAFACLGSSLCFGQGRDALWAFTPPRQSFAHRSIDGFIDEELMEEDLRPVGLASRRILARRLYYGLIGLPPSAVEVQAFVDDKSNDALAKLVDSLLASPHFGERWARHWLDVVRYSETKGHVTDVDRPHVWKYRDYVINALNDDVPYDRFVREHIAGDLLNGERTVAPAATGYLFFHEMHFMAVDPVKQRWDEIDAQIDVVSKAFLGLTASCARCHDHKTDPVSQADYYALAGIFYSTEQGRARVAGRDPVSAENRDELAEREKAYETFLSQQKDGRRQAQSKKNEGYFPISEELGVQSPGHAATEKKLREAIAKIDPSWAQWVRSAVDVKGVDVSLAIRGDYKSPGEAVPRGFFKVLTSREPAGRDLDSGSGRLFLAEQIVDGRNPLTARVYVNRLWHHLFGRGIVATPNDFGASGESPTHPELLDYLAKRLIDTGWSTKQIIREIVLSNAYGRSSNCDPGLKERDPENRWLARSSLRRLEAEALRDSILKVAGTLDPKIGGPSVQPWVPPYATANKPSNVPKSGPVDGNGRRSLYIRVRRNFPSPLLQKFDCPDPGHSIGRRKETITPGQALALMNSPFIHEQAKRWGRSVSEEQGSWPEKIAAMFEQAVGQRASADELKILDGVADDDSRGEAEVLGDFGHVILNLSKFCFVE